MVSSSSTAGDDVRRYLRRVDHRHRGDRGTGASKTSEVPIERPGCTSSAIGPLHAHAFLHRFDVGHRAGRSNPGGAVLTSLPLAGGSDGAAFNPATLEAFSTHGNGTLTVVKETSPTTFDVEQNLQTMNGARTIAFDSKTGHLLTMSDERGPAPPPPPVGGRAGRGAAIPGSFTILMIGR